MYYSNILPFYYGNTQSRRQGGALVGLARPNRVPSLPNGNVKHYRPNQSVEIL